MPSVTSAPLKTAVESAYAQYTPQHHSNAGDMPDAVLQKLITLGGDQQLMTNYGALRVPVDGTQVDTFSVYDPMNKTLFVVDRNAAQIADGIVNLQGDGQASVAWK
jgi:hypothetical protein